MLSKSCQSARTASQSPVNGSVRALQAWRALIIAAIWVASGDSAWSADCLTYGNLRTEVVGTLVRVTIDDRSRDARGKPITTTRWTVATDAVFCVKGDDALGNIDVRGASIVYLVPNEALALTSFLGKHVRVVGEIVDTLRPHYHPELEFVVHDISELKRGER